MSLLICFAVTPLVNAGLSQKTTIVRFVKDVKAGEEIKKGMLLEVEVGGYNLPENVLRSITEAEEKISDRRCLCRGLYRSRKSSGRTGCRK